MTKLVHLLGVTILAAFTLAGCELYFDESGGDGGGSQPGFSCTDNADCAAGCFCNDQGTCDEAGFCDTNDQCPDGFHCDDRSSCVPNNCDDANPCPSGQICENGTCTATCVCASDQEAKDQGFGFCDEATSTCYPGEDPAGSCAGEITCNIVAPNCPQGEVPLIKDGCYTGACKAIAQCDANPSCSALDNETDCAARSGDCSIVSTGINCTKPDGTACNSGDTNCTCESFKFAACEAK